MARKKKDKQKPRKPKVDLMAGAPRPKPLSLRGPRFYVENARDYPIMGCWVRPEWRESGLTPVVVARQQSPERVIFASILVDMLCLGVKNALYNGDFSMKRFQDNLPNLCTGEPEPMEVGRAHALIYGAIDFARQYGFEPHPDFKVASKVLDPPEAHPPDPELEFGRDGKPFFVSGPYDNVEAILAKLERTAGSGNYHFLIGYGDPGDFDE